MSANTRGNHLETPETDIATRPSDATPELWDVVFLNDDVTTFNCVVGILLKVFNMTRKQAWAFAKVVDATGWGIAGCYPKSVAENKRDEAIGIARSKGYPLQIKLDRQI